MKCEEKCVLTVLDDICKADIPAPYHKLRTDVRNHSNGTAAASLSSLPLSLILHCCACINEDILYTHIHVCLPAFVLHHGNNMNPKQCQPGQPGIAGLRGDFFLKVPDSGRVRRDAQHGLQGQCAEHPCSRQGSHGPSDNAVLRHQACLGKVSGRQLPAQGAFPPLLSLRSML